MEQYINRIKHNWQRFIEKGETPVNMKEEILNSWIRCREKGLNYEQGKIEVISPDKIAKIRRENAELIGISRPIMKSLQKIVVGSEFIIALTDKQGHIMELIGDENIRGNVEKLNFNLGANWSEEYAGTNAIGTSLFLNEPIQIIGSEHYCRNRHILTCSACIIHNDRGEIIGCLNMSGHYSKAHPHTLGMVVSAVHSIQKQMALIKSSKLLNLTFNSISDGMIITDENLKVKNANKMAEKILNLSRCEIFKLNISNTLKDNEFGNKVMYGEQEYHNFDCSFYVKNRRVRCSMNASPILIGNRAKGIVITFKEEGYVHKVVNKIAGYSASYTFEDIITNNSNVKKTIEFAKRASQSECNILLEAPSGTGKEVFAQAIHNYSYRSNGPFVAVNCASLPRELVESELFGYEKGAFTGALSEGNPGKFELANGGSIFLDEIGELPLDMQSKLLRVLDNKSITRIGGTYEKKLNVRIIAATNRNLTDEIEKRNFRSDLYYRLNVMNIKLLPLKDRKDDIEALANYFIYKLNLKNPNNYKSLSLGYVEYLKNYNWPGNIRELRNVVERAYYLCEKSTIDKDEFNESNLLKTNSKESKNNLLTMDDIEKNSIIKTLDCCNGNILEACEKLNISRATIYRKIKKYNIKL